MSTSHPVRVGELTFTCGFADGYPADGNVDLLCDESDLE